MNIADSLPWETVRLRLREATDEDVAAVESLFASNPDFVALRSDIAGSGAGYSREAVRDYCRAATIDPTRCLLAVDNLSTNQTVGIIDFVETSPADNVPWIGFVLVDGAQQRNGFGSEAVFALMDRLRSGGAQVVRMATLPNNPVGLAFASSLGFEAYERGAAAYGADVGSVVLLEATIGDGRESNVWDRREDSP